MKTKRILSLLIISVMVLCVFTGCGNTESVKEGNLDGPDKGLYATIAKSKNGGDLVGTAGTQVEIYSGYIGHGYDVIKSPYYNQDYIKNSCVLDTKKMAKDGVIYDDARPKIEFSSTAGETLSSYSERFNAKVGASCKGLFSGSMSVDFGLSSAVSEKTSFAKGMIEVVTRHQYVNMVTPKVLRDNYLSSAFQDALLDTDFSPEALFNEFGTHIMLSIDLGGRLDMSFVYNNIDSEDEMTLETKVEASCAKVSGSASTSQQENHAAFVSNSVFKLKAYGGTTTLDMQNFESAQKNLTDWQKSIENEGKTAFIKGGNISSEMEMCPIWKLIDKDASPKNLERYQEIEAKYKELLELAGQDIDNKQGEAMPKYIKNIYVGAGGNWESAIADVKSQTTEDVQVILADLNSNAGGAFVLIGYTVTENTKEALRDVTFRWDMPIQEFTGQVAQPDGTFRPVKYTLTKKPWDCNLGTKKGDNIWMYYTHDANAGAPITDLYVAINFNLSGRNGTTNWERAQCCNVGWDMELNSGAGGDYVFLWLRR